MFPKFDHDLLFHLIDLRVKLTVSAFAFKLCSMEFIDDFTVSLSLFWMKGSERAGVRKETFFFDIDLSQVALPKREDGGIVHHKFY